MRVICYAAETKWYTRCRLLPEYKESMNTLNTENGYFSILKKTIKIKQKYGFNRAILPLLIINNLKDALSCVTSLHYQHLM